MSIIDDASELLNNDDVKTAAFDLLSDSAEALSGSLFASRPICTQGQNILDEIQEIFRRSFYNGGAKSKICCETCIRRQ